jgi:DNA-binding transcriptional regulator YdaS (Cro superfamily)
MTDADPRFRELVRRAVAIVGSQPTLAERIGKSQQHVSSLCRTASFISAEDAISIHRATAGKVSASELRPDLWKSPEHVPTPEAAS